ncbi:MAG: UDP-N-acetylmuramoyl-L-alanine--D-glutamate ligase [Syntrophomonadaceae bacterium]|jgi:UDP-N-acetylmuramoylalanine--D-glutamate ligase
MDFNGKRVLVIGLARSGIAAIKALASRGALLTGTDRKTRDQLGDSLLELDQLQVRIFAGSYPPVSREYYDLVVTSPGVPLDIKPLKAAREANIPIMSELELAYLLKPENIQLLAISGTNGKTTTVKLLQAILTNDGYNTMAGGNIGIPLTTLVNSLSTGVIVVETSSFQLETTDNFRPHICALLNITPDHLDRHQNFENYVKAKAKIYANQTGKDFAVLNYEDLHIRRMAEQCPSRVIYFSTERILEEGSFIRDNHIYFVYGGKVQLICAADKVSLRGKHNLENILCAVAVAAIAGVRTESIAKTLMTFAGVRHRIEEVAIIDGVLYVNDSKATNPESAIKALESFNEPVILIAGGRSKGSNFTEFASHIPRKVKGLILLGEAKAEIKKAVMDYGFKNIHEVNDLSTAVNKARELAANGDVVLLSPACASWDMFESYEHRGDLFCQLVRAIQAEQ